MNTEIIAIECSRRRPDLWNIWTLERIKKAFAMGRGTTSDFKRFVRDNSRFATFITTPTEIAEFIAKNGEEVTAL